MITLSKHAIHRRPTHPPLVCGSALAETILSAGLLALAVPWIHAAWRASRIELNHAAMESISAQVTNACLAQISASRQGLPSMLPRGQANQPTPPQGEIWSLGFNSDGSLLGRVSTEHYQSGCDTSPSISSAKPAGLVRIESLGTHSVDFTRGDEISPPVAPLPLRLTLEFPANLPANARHKLAFHTLTP